MAAPKRVGSVALVGAGPGDPGFITVRGLALLRGAEVVVYDRLGSSALMAHAREDAERIYVGKQAGRHVKTQDQIGQILLDKALEGKTVVRLKGGDPFVFGRGGEEAELLVAAGVPFEVVPGVTSAIAGPGAAGIPVTHRDAAASLIIATAHEAPGKAGSRLNWSAVAAADTAVLLMGVERLSAVAEALMSAGKSGDTPAAVIQEATLPTQRTVTAPLSQIAAVAKREGIHAPAITIVGDVVRLRDVLGGRDQRPLSGARVLVTRTREQASDLSRILQELGAEVVEAPAIRIDPPRSWAPVDRAVARLSGGGYAWVVFTSANGVRLFASRLREAGLDARAFAGARVCAVGPATAEALGSMGIAADFMPSTFTTESVGAEFPKGEGRVLLARADKVEPGLDDALVAKGWTVDKATVYRLAGGSKIDPEIRRAVRNGDIDVITFASGGTVAAFMRLLKEPPPRSTKIVCIGPVTAKAARAAGLRVSAVADPHTIPALAAAVLDVAGKRAPKRGAKGGRSGRAPAKR